MPPPISRLLKAIVTLGLTAWVLTTLNPETALSLVRTAHPAYLGAVLGLGLAGILISACKWSVILKTLDIQVPFDRVLRLFWIGVFFNNFLPGRTGGDLIRAYGISRHTANRPAAVLSVVADRILNLLVLVCIACAALPFGPAGTAAWLPLTAGAFCAGTLATAGILTCLSRRLGPASRAGRLLHQGVRAIQTLWHRPAPLLAATALAAVYQTTMILGNYGAALGLGLHVSPAVFFYLVPITALVTLLPVSLNGFGLREGAYILTFTHAGISPEASVILSLTVTLCMIALSLIGGILYGFDQDRTRAQPGHPAADRATA